MSQEFPDPLAMARALEVARNGLGRVSPNPPVGAVLVAAEDSQQRAEGWHQVHGGPHAEVNCLEAAKQAGIDAKGADLYVTLEPCAHHGKTPPCVDSIIGAQIARVIVSTDDPNPVTSGQSYPRLAAAGIEVVRGFLAEDGKWLIAPYLCHIRNGRPLVTAKWAMTADGRIACSGGDSRWITAEETRVATRRARSEVDAILVGVGTIAADDPQLTSRTEDRPEPVRVVIDPGCRTPVDARLFESETALLIYCSEGAATSDSAQALRRCGAEVVPLPATEGEILIVDLLHDLAARGVQNLLVEGGADTHGRFLDADLVDRVQILIAPNRVGGGRPRDRLGERAFPGWNWPVIFAGVIGENWDLTRFWRGPSLLLAAATRSPRRHHLREDDMLLGSGLSGFQFASPRFPAWPGSSADGVNPCATGCWCSLSLCCY